MSYYDPCTGVGRAVVAAAVPGGGLVVRDGGNGVGEKVLCGRVPVLIRELRLFNGGI